jgi:hypothetical protein
MIEFSLSLTKESIVNAISTVQRSATVLGDFNRSVRDEPYYLVYRHRIYVANEQVPFAEVAAWLRQRYTEQRRGHRYRIVTYKAQNGSRYVDHILMETCKDEDLVWIKLRWGYSNVKVHRGDRLVRKRLNSAQKVKLDAILKATRDEFYKEMYG